MVIRSVSQLAWGYYTQLEPQMTMGTKIVVNFAQFQNGQRCELVRDMVHEYLPGYGELMTLDRFRHMCM